MTKQVKKYFLWFAVIDAIILALVLIAFLPMNINERLLQGLLIPKDSVEGADIGVVLGAGLRPGGGVSDLAQERVDYMLPIAEEQELSFIFSGGETPRGIEAIAMNNYAKAKGYTGLDHIEASSHSTYENALYSDQLLDQDRFQDDIVLVITSPSHAKRAKAVFTEIMPEREVRISFPDETVFLDDSPLGRLKGVRGLAREYLAGYWYKLRYGISL